MRRISLVVPSISCEECKQTIESTLKEIEGVQEAIVDIANQRVALVYDPDREVIYVSPEDQLDAPPAKEIAAHEYGHHVANNRNDAPWSAVDYGAKRWSSSALGL